MTENNEEIKNEKEELDTESIKNEFNKGNVLDVAPGCLGVEVPCGYIDKEGKVHTTIIVKEMTGKEEDILVSKGGDFLTKTNAILRNCIVQIGEIDDKQEISGAIKKMTAYDRMMAIFAIRRVSLGDFYDPEVTCPEKSCKKIFNIDLNLSDVEVIPMKERGVLNRKDVLESGKEVEWHIMTYNDEVWLSSMQKKMSSNFLTLAMLARIDSFDGEKIKREDKKQIKKSIEILASLTTRERTEVRSLFDKYEGKVDTEVEIECPDCGQEWKARMDISQPSFFFPSAT